MSLRDKILLWTMILECVLASPVVYGICKHHFGRDRLES